VCAHPRFDGEFFYRVGKKGGTGRRLEADSQIDGVKVREDGLQSNRSGCPEMTVRRWNHPMVIFGELEPLDFEFF
jgi:hypothetical protein